MKTRGRGRPAAKRLPVASPAARRRGPASKAAKVRAFQMPHRGRDRPHRAPDYWWSLGLAPGLGAAVGAGLGGVPGRIAARYDAAQTTDDNSRYWSAADALSADAALQPGIRRILRNRARYETANNAYARGMVLTLAQHVVGTGPRLHIRNLGAEASRAVERRFARWAAAAGLAAKLRTMRTARCVDGEAFALLTTSDRLRDGVKLNPRLVEADQVTTPTARVERENFVDGVELDEAGDVVRYHVLKDHPGGASIFRLNQFDALPAEQVVHWFRADRPGQHRGVPELVAALPIFSQLRRFILAVLDAAETAADFTACVYTDAPADGQAARGVPFDFVELERKMLTTLPDGWKLAQLRPEQPASTFAEFKQEMLGEAARCMCMSFNLASGNSSSYSWATGELDHQIYWGAITVDRADCGLVVLDPLVAAWWQEARRVAGYLPDEARALAEAPDHEWFWDSPGSVDQVKTANARDIALRNGTGSLEEYAVEDGMDSESILASQARSLGYEDVDAYRAALRAALLQAAKGADAEADEPPDDKPGGNGSAGKRLAGNRARRAVHMDSDR